MEPFIEPSMEPSIDALWYYNLHNSFPSSATDSTAAASIRPAVPRHNDDSPQIQELHRVFDAMDADHDGELSGSELCIWMKKLGLAFSEEGMLRMVEHRDVRHCGSLDFDEFVDLNRDIEAEEEGTCARSHQGLLMEVFRVFDRDHDGLISPKELSVALQGLGLVKKKREDSEYVDMIKRVDSDGDGQVSFSEFQNMMDHKNVLSAVHPQN